MKILRVISSMNPASGGPCQGIRNSIPALEAIGVYNEVVCLDCPTEEFIKQDSFKINAIGPSKTPWCYSERLIPFLKNNLPRFDVVIVHGLWLFHGFATLKAIKFLLKKASRNNSENVPKLFVMPHGMLDPYFQLATDRKLKALRNQLYWKLITSKLINSADGILFTTETELKLARTTFPGYYPKRELNIGYGIQPPPDASITQNSFFCKFPILKNRPFFLFLSRIHKKKGLDILLEAYEKVYKKSFRMSTVSSSDPGDSLYEDGGDDFPLLVIAGPGLDSIYGKKIEEYVRASEILSKSVVFTGMLSGDLKWDAFQKCEAMILPSHQENFGIAVVEALACAKPVMISNQVNTWCEISKHEAGLVAEDTLEGTVELFEKWVALSVIERKQMGINAKDCYETNFAIKPAAMRMYKVLSE